LNCINKSFYIYFPGGFLAAGFGGFLDFLGGVGAGASLSLDFFYLCSSSLFLCSSCAIYALD